MELLATLDENDVDIACIAETKIYGEDLSTAEWTWLAGAETLPKAGGSTPRMGLGMLVRSAVFPLALVVKKGKYTLWVKLPGVKQDLYVCSCYIPVYKSDKKPALKELWKYYRHLSTKGIVLVGGDFNARCGANGDAVTSTFGRRLLKESSDEKACIINLLKDRCTGEFTRVQEAYIKKTGQRVTHRTTIDYTIIPNAQQHRVVRLTIMDHRGLHSDHKLLLLVMMWKHKATPLTPGPRRFSLKWNLTGMTPDGWLRFEDQCDDLLAIWMADFETRSDQVQDRPMASELWEKWLQALCEAASKAVGYKRVCAGSKSWMTKDLRMLLAQRKQAGQQVREASPSSKPAACARLKELRAKTHARIKRCKSAVLHKRNRSIEGSMQHAKAFWRRWKSTKISSGGSSSIPDAVLDESGSIITDPLQLLRTWHDFVKQLSTEDKIPAQGGRFSKDGFDDDFGREVLARLRSLSLENGHLPELDKVVTWEEVHNAIRSMKTGKAPGPDGIPVELLREGGISVAVTLASLYNYAWDNLDWPENLQEAFLTPIFKNRGSKLYPGDYRMIATESVVAKVLEKIIDVRIRTWSERVSALSDLQGGFRANRGTVDQIFILDEISAARKDRDLVTYCAFIDVHKAYDRVWRPGLWTKLYDIGIKGRCLQLLRTMFGRVSRRIRINGDLTDAFEVTAGVPQGSVLSPFLYAVYINGLHAELHRAGLGVRVHGTLVPLLLYADDVVLMARSPAELQRMLTVLERYAARWRFQVNNTKSEVVIVGTPSQKRSTTNIAQWSLAGSVLKIVPEYKYLGAETGKKVGPGRWDSLLRRLWGKANHALKEVLFRAGGSDGLCPAVLRRLWMAEVRPQLEYACELWEGEISQTWVQKFESLQSQFCKAALGLTGNPSSIAMRTELKLPSLRLRRCKLKMGYWVRLCSADPNRLLHKVLRYGYANVSRDLVQYSHLHAFKATLLQLDLYPLWDRWDTEDKDLWNGAVEGRLEALEQAEFDDKATGSSPLRRYRDLELAPFSSVPQYLADRSNILGTRLLTECRLGCLQTMSTLAIIMRWPAHRGHCMLCSSGVPEDVPHFVMDCPALSQARNNFVQLLKTSLPAQGTPGNILWTHFQSSYKNRLSIILGAGPSMLHKTVTNTEEHGEAWAKACWILDKATKNFLMTCWRIRECTMGRLTVRAGRIVHEPPSPRALRTLNSQRHQDMLPPTIPADRRWDWSRWLPRPTKTWRRTGKKGPANFYVVYKGRTRGLFYKWADVLPAIAGFAEARFQGFHSLAAATQAASSLEGEV